MYIAKDLTDLIGRTPVMELGHVFPDSPSRILAKVELCNPTSIKDRAMLNMIQKAMQAGQIKPGSVVVEATSGNTGIALASLATIMGFQARIYMSEACSIERQKLICAYGATVVLTPAAEHTRGARDRAIAYCEANPDTTFFASQHTNPENGGAHYVTTGPELWEQTGGEIDAVVIGLGTCGTFEGLSRYFKEQNPNIHMVGVEPAGSPVYSGGSQGEHRINGIGPGMITENFERSRDRVDEILLVEDDVAFDWARKVTLKEGVIVGPTSGVTVWGAGELAKRPEFAGKTIICFLYDSGERYLSIPDLFATDTVEHEA
jgi:cysteine synthase